MTFNFILSKQGDDSIMVDNRIDNTKLDIIIYTIQSYLAQYGRRPRYAKSRYGGICYLITFKRLNKAQIAAFSLGDIKRYYVSTQISPKKPGRIARFLSRIKTVLLFWK